MIHEGIFKPVIIGQSMGGYIAQALMEKYPYCPAGFISIDSAPLKREYMKNGKYMYSKIQNSYIVHIHGSF